MNLHQFSEDVVLAYLYHRYNSYTFKREGPTQIVFRYLNEINWNTMSHDDYLEYERAAIAWKAQGGG